MSANSETVSALVKTVKAVEARTRCDCGALSSTSRSGATEIATNSRPISAPATPAEASKKSWNPSMVNPRSVVPRPDGAAPHHESRLSADAAA